MKGSIGGGTNMHSCGGRAHCRMASSAVRQQTTARGIDACGMFAGVHMGICPWYAALDVSVLSSLSERLCLTLLESMDHGLPFVATSVGGSPEVVVDCETGFLGPPAQTGA